MLYYILIIFQFQILFNTNVCASSLSEDYIPVRQKRIIDGKLTKIKKYPFQVAIINSNSFLCSGSLITHNIVLTTAHCFDDVNLKNYKIIVRAGSTNSMHGGFTSNVREVIKHEKYNRKIYDYDIAILKLNNTGFLKQINKGLISLINLPKQSPFQMKPIPVFGYLAGWGTINEDDTKTVKLLREIKLQIMSQKACHVLHNDNSITTRMFCAGYIEGGKDACAGDSGGPLIINNDVMIGMVSWGEGCGRELLPTVFTHVYYLRNWINQWM